MWKAVFALKELGEFGTFPEAFKAIYDEIKKQKTITVIVLETATWIIRSGSNKVSILFNEARDLMCDEGYLVDGKFVENPFTNGTKHISKL